MGVGKRLDRMAEAIEDVSVNIERLRNTIGTVVAMLIFLMVLVVGLR
jgi:TRAP-type mannitol/chloroaromatic compound transport system permease small subunit